MRERDIVVSKIFIFYVRELILVKLDKIRNRGLNKYSCGSNNYKN